MAWEEELFALFDDLEHQAAAIYDAERAVELADRSRAEYASVTLASRFMASLGCPVVIDTLGAGPLTGTLRRVGDGWCLLSGGGQDWIVRLAAVTALHDPSARSVPELAWSPVTKLGLGSALRRLADAGDRCVVHQVDGERHDGLVLRVGQDFAELELSGGRVVLVAFGAMAAVQSLR
jgi:hypothetical protein